MATGATFGAGALALTKAERYDTDGSTLLHRYAYTYDAGDNMVTKTVFDGANTDTYAMTYNDANELTAQAVGGVATDFAYDEWGRMTSKAISGSYSATYAYRYGNKLYSVTSDFPSEGTVTYESGGDQKRRSRSVSGGAYTWYNWDIGWNVINEEKSIGSLARTYIEQTMAHVDGTDPSTGSYTYYFQDHVGSSRRLRDASKSSVAEYEYMPYGDVYASSGTTTATTRTYALLSADDTAQLYFAPFRYYDSRTGRWITRDPLGMSEGLNLYLYCAGNALGRVDPLGASWRDWLPTDINVEWGFIYARGVAKVTCCDQYGRKHIAIFKKWCLGIVTGISATYHELDTAAMAGGEGCPNDYKGWFREYSFGSLGLLDFQFSDDVQGAGGGLGLARLPASGKMCKYTPVDDQIVGCCG